MSSDAMCAKCGSTDTLYREIEVTVDGWRDLTVTFEADGRLSVDEGHLERDGGIADEMPGDYCCSQCGAKARKLEDLVARADSAATVCCCGHGLGAHKEQKFDSMRFTRGRRVCTELCCGCWDFETDPALATVVRQEVAT